MSTATPIDATELDFDNGSFDTAAFARQALASPQSLAAVIDHTLLKPEATRAQIEQICSEAAEYRFACAMVNPVWASVAVRALEGTGVPVGVVIGFPLGASLVSTLCAEAESLTRLGAKELDMVLPVGPLKSGDRKAVQHAISTTAEVAHEHGALLKVILENALLSTEEKLLASELSITAGADFIKTSTGFAKTGATASDVALMRGVAGARCGVKAAGGIRTLDDVRAMLEAGANRIGASASIAILSELVAE